MFSSSPINRIEQHLEAGNLQAAAELLVASPQRQHRSVRPFAIRCAAELIQQANSLYQSGALQQAREHLELANQCVPLDGEDRALLTCINSKLEELAKENKHHQEMRCEAEKLAAEGRFRTAIGRLGGSDKVEDEFARKAYAQKLEDAERFVADCESLIDQGRTHDAREMLRRAEEVSPRHPRLQSLRESCHVAGPADFAYPCVSRHKPLLLEFASSNRRLLLTFPHTVSIGTPRDGDALGADIPLPGLHRQHATIYRHTRGRSTSYWITSHPSHHSYVAANGRTLKSDGQLDLHLLSDGDLIELGASPEKISQALVFQRPMSEDGTAILSIVRGETPGDPTIGPRCPQDISQLMDGVVLFDRAFIVGTAPGECHQIDFDLPVAWLRYSWEGDALRFAVSTHDINLKRVPKDECGSKTSVEVRSHTSVILDRIGLDIARPDCHTPEWEVYHREI